MPTELFPRSKPSKDCLSGWSVSQLALGLLSHEALAPAEAHLSACSHCRQRVEDERAQIRAAALERVPEELLRAAATTAPERPRWWTWRSWAMGPAFAAVAATVLFLLVRPTVGVDAPDTLPGERLKGSTSLDVAVMREGTLVVEGVPAEEVEDLRSGDQLRPRVTGATPSAWLILQGDEEDRWTTYFEGPPPADGWLPVAVLVTPDGRTRLRLLECPAQPPSGTEQGCRERVYAWRVSGGP
ncbi:anti-sigma factor family protein [Archangium minus]|uniref:anti-sigma factor family protein n=1 Tax=Archangium minus TaxID=83450 RepID=UPI0037BF1B33